MNEHQKKIGDVLLHVDNISHVVNYDLPQSPEDYVHRIGRTARAGASGIAISLACEDYVYSLEGIEEYIGRKIEVDWIDEDMYAKDIVAAPPRSRSRGRRPHPSGPGRGGPRKGRPRGRSAKRT